jgi:magnesium transporter
VSFRIMDIEAGAIKVEEGPYRAKPPAAGTLRWIDLEHQDERALGVLRESFDFHPLTLEDCLHFDQRPKLEEYGAYLFIVVHGFKVSGDLHDVEPLELHAFLGKDYLVTVHEAPIPELETVWKRVLGDAALGRRGADFIYYLIVDTIVDANFAILDRLSDALDEIEDEVLNRHKQEHLGQIFMLKRVLVSMRRVLSPQRDVFAILSKRGHPCISEMTSLYFRDVYDHLVRIYESIDTGRDLLGNALDAYLSMVALRTNEIMKRLTILSAVFLPLTFVTGFFGQNFTHLPFDSDALMVVAIVSLIVIPSGMLLWFWRWGWIKGDESHTAREASTSETSRPKSGESDRR